VRTPSWTDGDDGNGDGDGDGDGEVIVPEALRQVGWLRQRQRQSFHKLRVINRPQASRGKRYSFRSAALFGVALPSTLSSWLLSASGLSSVLSVIIFILYSVPVCQRSLWAGIGPAPSTGRRPAAYSSIGPCAHTYLYVLVFNFTNMHAMSHRSDFFLACTSKGNIEEPAVYPTIMYHLTVIHVE